MNKLDIKIGDLYFNGKYQKEMVATERCIQSIPFWLEEDYEIRKIHPTKPFNTATPGQAPEVIVPQTGNQGQKPGNV